MERFLTLINLSQYFPLFAEYGLNDNTYMYVSLDDLKDMGIAIVGHRIKIIKHSPGTPLTPEGNVQYRINQLKRDLDPLFQIAQDLELFLKEKSE